MILFPTKFSYVKVKVRYIITFSDVLVKCIKLASAADDDTVDEFDDPLNV